MQRRYIRRRFLSDRERVAQYRGATIVDRTRKLNESLERARGRLTFVQTLGVCLLPFLLSPPTEAADFQCFDGETQCLIDSINAANALPDRARAHRIFLFPGAPYRVDRVHDPASSGSLGLTGLPAISTNLQIIGVRPPTGTVAGLPPTIFRPADIPGTTTGFPPIRFFLVTPESSLHLENLIIEGGRAISDNCRAIEPRGAGGAVLVLSRSKEEAQRLRGNFFDPTNPSEVNARGDITIDGVIFDVNQATCAGGAIFMTDVQDVQGTKAPSVRQLRVTKSVFTENIAPGIGPDVPPVLGGLTEHNPGFGGAIGKTAGPQPIDPDEFVVTDSVFEDNFADRGGAIHAENAYLGDVVTLNGRPTPEQHVLRICPTVAGVAVNCNTFRFRQGSARGSPFCLEKPPVITPGNTNPDPVSGTGPGRAGQISTESGTTLAGTMDCVNF
jgi:hypothetical protein